MNKIKIFTGRSRAVVAGEVNEFLMSVEYVDVRFTSSDIDYEVLIVYREVK